MARIGVSYDGRSIRSVALAVALLCALLPVRSQFEDPRRDSLQRVYDPRMNTYDQLVCTGELASSWMVSTKALPYIKRLDTLTLLFMQDPDFNIRQAAKQYRINYHVLAGYQAKFRRDIPAALDHFQRARDVHVGLFGHVHEGAFLDAMGVLFRSVGEPRQAIALLEEAIPQWIDTLWDYRAAQDLSRTHLAVSHADVGEWDRAERCLSECDTSVVKTHSGVLAARAYVKERQGDLNEALLLLQQALAVLDGSKYEWDRIAVLTAMARLHAIVGKHSASSTAAEECIRIAGDRGDEAAWCTCRILAGKALMAMGNTNDAEHYLLNALDTARVHGYLGLARETGDEGSMVQAAALLRDIYLGQNRLKEAVEMTTYWSELKDTLNLMDGRLEVLRTSMRREALTDSLELVRMAKEAQCESDGQLQREQDRRRSLLSWGSIALALLSVLAYFLVNRLKQTRRLAALEKNQLQQEAVIAELRVREELRRDVHDDLGSGLSALKLRSELALREEQEGPNRERLRSLSAKADELMSSMRELLWSMDTERRNLRDTVDHCVLYARAYLSEHDIKLDLSVSDNWPDLKLDPRQRRNLFLVVKEALHNVVKHAKAKGVTMTWRWSSGMELVIQDDGIGLPASSSDHAGNGLNNMRDRIQELGGTLDVDNAPGVRLHCRITEAALGQR